MWAPYNNICEEYNRGYKWRWLSAGFLLLKCPRQHLLNMTLWHLWQETDHRTMDGNVTGQWMQHFVLRKLVLFTVMLTEEAYFLRKMKELRKQRLSHQHRHWSCDTGLTHRLYELKLLPLLDLLDEADILQRGPREVPLLHLQGGVSLKKGKHKQKRLKMCKANLSRFNGTKSFLTSSWWQLSRHSPIQISLIFCAIVQ